jgi:hypothetical protein
LVKKKLVKLAKEQEMALETLKDVTEIGGFKVLAKRPKDKGETDWALFDEQRKEKPIYIDHDVNMISFRIQDGPIKENGVNGCQVDTLLHTALVIIRGLNRKFPSTDNDIAIAKIGSALVALDRRKNERIARGVEGRSLK